MHDIMESLRDLKFKGQFHKFTQQKRHNSVTDGHCTEIVNDRHLMIV